MNARSQFSERDLQVLEVHEGWVHVGTTLNGMNQPVCTFLSKGPPSSTITQEGLAILMEVIGRHHLGDGRMMEVYYEVANAYLEELERKMAASSGRDRWRLITSTFRRCFPFTGSGRNATACR